MLYNVHMFTSVHAMQAPVMLKTSRNLSSVICTCFQQYSNLMAYHVHVHAYISHRGLYATN